MVESFSFICSHWSLKMDETRARSSDSFNLLGDGCCRRFTNASVGENGWLVMRCCLPEVTSGRGAGCEMEMAIWRIPSPVGLERLLLGREMAWWLEKPVLWLRWIAVGGGGSTGEGGHRTTVFSIFWSIWVRQVAPTCGLFLFSADF